MWVCNRAITAYHWLFTEIIIAMSLHIVEAICVHSWHYCGFHHLWEYGDCCCQVGRNHLKDEKQKCLPTTIEGIHKVARDIVYIFWRIYWISSQVLDEVSPNVSEVQCSIALAHPERNRDTHYLPCECDWAELWLHFSTILNLIQIFSWPLEGRSQRWTSWLYSCCVHQCKYVVSNKIYFYG